MKIEEFIGDAQASALKANDIDVNSIEKIEYQSGTAVDYRIEAVFHSVFDEDIDFSFSCQSKYDFADKLKHTEITGYTLRGIGDELQEIRDEELFGAKIIEVLNEADIAITSVNFSERDDENVCVEMEFFSPAGEDFVFTLWFVEDDRISFVEAFKEYANDFDPETYAGEWYNNRNGVRGVPQSLRALLKDADAIKDMLEITAKALDKAAIKIDEELVKQVSELLPNKTYKGNLEATEQLMLLLNEQSSEVLVTADDYNYFYNESCLTYTSWEQLVESESEDGEPSEDELRNLIDSIIYELPCGWFVYFF